MTDSDSSESSLVDEFTTDEPSEQQAYLDLIQALEARLDAQSTQIDNLRERLDEERERRETVVADLEERLETAREERSQLQAQVAEVDARTDMLELVEKSDELGPKQRAATLLQHAYRKARTRKQRDEPPMAALDHDDAERALHYPDLERTTLYKDMNRAAKLVRDAGGNDADDVVRYDDGELRLDLEAGDLPPRFTDTDGGENL